MRSFLPTAAAALVTSFLLPGCGSADAGAFVDPGTPEDSGLAVVDSTAGADSTAATDTTVIDGATPVDSSAPIDSGKPADDTGVIAVDTAVVDVGTDVPTTKKCTVASAKVYGGHCYFRLEARNWNESRDGCTLYSSHLATIGSDGEQKVVASLGPGSERWIGLAKDFTAPATKTSYKWLTGEASTYENWAIGEPNGSGSCVRLLGDDTWADRDCFNSLSSICEEE